MLFIITDVKLTDSEWSFLEEIRDALVPVADLTTLIQKETLKTTEFVEQWLLMVGKLRKYDTTAANTLKIQIAKREDEIFQNPYVLVGWYLNKRVNSKMTETQIEIAKNLIRDIEYRELKIKYGEELMCMENETDEMIELNETPLLSNNINYDDPLEAELIENDIAQSQSSHVSVSIHHSQKIDEFNQRKQQLEKDFENYDNMKRASEANQNYLTYWNSQDHLPELKFIAPVLITVPVTEVSVERLFSHLNFILSKRRSHLRGELLDAILKLRTNPVFGLNQ